MRLRALALLSVLSLVLLGACGDDDSDDSPEAQTFCTVVTPIQDLQTVLEQDVAGVQARMTAAESALAAVSGTPPEGIAADIEVVKEKFDAANAALKPVGYDYEQVAEEDFAALDGLSDTDFQTAADNIQAWSEDNC